MTTDCKGCDGKGRIYEYDGDANYRQCWDCEGSGKVAEPTCESCEKQCYGEYECSCACHGTTGT